jgi:hypothetical protein
LLWSHLILGGPGYAQPHALFALNVVPNDVVEGVPGVQQLITIEETLDRLLEETLRRSHIRLLQSPAQRQDAVQRSALSVSPR